MTKEPVLLNSLLLIKLVEVDRSNSVARTVRLMHENYSLLSLLPFRKKNRHRNAHSAQNHLGFNQVPNAEIPEQAKSDLLTI
jgi:hypothetical protein